MRAAHEQAVRDLDILTESLCSKTSRPQKREIGHISARCLGEQDGNRYTLSEQISEGGGVCAVPGFSGLQLGEMIEQLEKRLADPVWVSDMTPLPAATQPEGESRQEPPENQDIWQPSK